MAFLLPKEDSNEGVKLMRNLQMELLQILKEDCRLPLEQLATMTGANMEEVAAAIAEMEKILENKENTK